MVTKSPANCSRHGFDPRSRKIPGGTKPVATAPESVGPRARLCNRTSYHTVSREELSAHRYWKTLSAAVKA